MPFPITLHSVVGHNSTSNKMLWTFVPLVSMLLNSLAISLVASFAGSEKADLRQLLQNYPQNQDLIANLGTKYEIVYPHQMRPDRISGLSTRRPLPDDQVHIPKTSLLIVALHFKFLLDLELNTDLLAPTLVQSFILEDSKHLTNEEIENCYYHATIRNNSDAVAAFQTCDGIRGVIYFEDKVFSIHPLHGNHASNHPHLLYNHITEDEDISACESDEGGEQYHSKQCLRERLHQTGSRVDELSQKKYIELGIILDKAFFEMHNSPAKAVIANAIQTVNCVDLHYNLLNTSISIVYIELWTQDQFHIEPNMSHSLGNFQQYLVQKLSPIPMDAVQLFSGDSQNDGTMGGAIMDNICTVKAIGISKVNNIYMQHVFVHTVVHMLGHNLGMYHDHECCKCPFPTGCHMSNNLKSLHSYHFSSCSIAEYYETLRKGHGACLFNMPMMRKSICGNGIVEKEEECDCGSIEDCQNSDSCCDSCKFMKNAECSSGPCCEKCKLLKSDSICRPSKGECDIPEYCDGKNGQCPLDLYMKTGTTCSESNGYCYQGTCPVIKQQCETFWGKDAEGANAICFERFNVQGTPNGNCGQDSEGDFVRCSEKNALCGLLQCHHGQKVPISVKKPIQFAVNKINYDGKIHECKPTPSYLISGRFLDGIVKDGSKCGYRKLCVNRSCVNIKSIASGSCPTGSSPLILCSGRGACTNMNTCHCEEGWTGDDCSRVHVTEPTLTAEEMNGNLQRPIQVLSRSTTPEQTGKRVIGNLSITIIVASTFIGVALVTSIILVLLYSKNMLGGNCRKSYGTYK